MTFAKPINKYIDYIDAPEDTFEQYVEKALRYNFRCVFANLQEYETGRAMLEDSDIILAGAIDFPQGTMTLEEKLARFEEYAARGFTEIDYVLNQESVENRDFVAIEREMTAVADFCRAHGITDKVIVEMCSWTATMSPSVASVRLRWRLSRDSKTSTGRSYGGAKLEDVRLMHEVLGDAVAIKAAGGIHNYEEACAFIEAGASALGASAGIAIVEGAPTDERR
ncbi:MAG: deoxyribose-phosphate aldolase [Collinsella sp.]